MSSRKENKQEFLNNLAKLGKVAVTRSEIMEVCQRMNIPGVQWFTNNKDNRIGRGMYKVPGTIEPVMLNHQANVIPMTQPPEKSQNKIANVITELETINLVPAVYKNYVPFGDFDDIVSI